MKNNQEIPVETGSAMNWSEQQIKDIVLDLIDENPMACSAILKISTIEFTTKVNTMAVSLSSKPVLYINLEFCNQYAQSENDIKAVLIHEFLHVLLLHTESFKENTPLLNICLDAIINAIIDRTFGWKYSNFFMRFYRWIDFECLLRPRNYTSAKEAKIHVNEVFIELHDKIYRGKYCAEDLHEVLEYLLQNKIKLENLDLIFIGNHGEIPNEISKENEKILDGIMKKMDGVGIWKKDIHPGFYHLFSEVEIETKNRKRKWENKVLKLLKKCLINERQKEQNKVTETTFVPVMNQKDKRAISKLLYSSILPVFQTELSVTQPEPEEKTIVYLDVSGSMDNELQGIISVLIHLKKYIRTPVYTFSNGVLEAEIKNNKLIYETSYGTSIIPVFEHIKKNNFKKALIVTDGYTEKFQKENMLGIAANSIKVLLTPGGNPATFEDKEIEYHYLPEY